MYYSLQLQLLYGYTLHDYSPFVFRVLVNPGRGEPKVDRGEPFRLLVQRLI